MNQEPELSAQGDVDAVSFEKQVYDVLWDMRIAPRHQIEQAAQKIAGLAAREEWKKTSKDNLPASDVKEIQIWDSEEKRTHICSMNKWEDLLEYPCLTHWRFQPIHPKD